MKRWVFILTLLFATEIAVAQPCGTLLHSTPSWDRDLIDPYVGIQRTGSIDSVGIAVHILADALNPVTREEIELELDAVNIQFEQAGIHFFICSFGELYGQTSFSADQMDIVNRELHVDGQINLYIPRIFTRIGNIQLCGRASFPWEGDPHERYVVVSRKCLGNGSTLLHELGHFYGLLHTHETSNGAEFVNGENCSTAGDLLCDTPADPGIESDDMNGCEFTALLYDPNGDLYAPDPSLIMSYAPHECRYRFSHEQYGVMRYFREELRDAYRSECSTLPDIALTANVSHDSLQFHETVIIDINLTHTLDLDTFFDLTLLISDSRLSYDQVIYQELIATTAEHGEITHRIALQVPSGLTAGQYYLKITADHDRGFAESNELNNQHIHRFVLDHENWKPAAIFPNPAGNVLNLFYRTDTSTDRFTVDIYDMTGREVRSLEFETGGSELYATIDISELTAGPYALRLTAPEIDLAKTWIFIATGQ